MTFRRVPLLLPLLGLILGISSKYFDCGDIPAVVIVAALSIVALYIKRSYFAIIGCSFIIGWLAETLTYTDRNIILDPKLAVECRGTITDVKVTASGEAVFVEITAIGKSKTTIAHIHPFRAIINLNEFETNLQPFDIIEFKTKLIRPEPYVELPDDYNAEEQFKLNGIKAIGFMSITGIRTLGREESLRAKLFRVRQHIAEMLNNSGTTPECSDFLKAILLGDADSLTKNERNIYSDAGLAHILALSGTHVAIISGMVLILLMPLRKFGLRTEVYLFSIAFMWFYALLIGFAPSVTRSVIMMSVLFLARITSRRVNSLNALCFAGIMILSFSPHSLFTPSFQLSFCAVGSILLFTNCLTLYHGSNRPVRLISQALAVTLAAILGTSLLAAYYFHKFPVYGALANLPVTLLLPLLISFGMIIVLTGLIGVHVPLLATVADWLFDGVTWVAGFFSSLPGAVVEGIYFGGEVFVPFVLALLGLAMFVSLKDKFYLYSSSLLFLITFFLLLPEKAESGVTHIYFTGNSRGSEIIVESNNAAYFASTRTNVDPVILANELKRKHPDFLSRRNLHEFQPIDWDGTQLEIEGRRFLFIRTEDDMKNRNGDVKFNYCVILSQITPESVVDLHNLADTVILPKELHINHVNKIRETLTESFIPYYSLREHKLNIHVSNISNLN